MKIDQAIFRAYDIRGTYPDQINAEIAYRIGRAFVKLTGAKKVVVGRDLRQASADMMDELVKGLIDEGADVTSIGEIANDMLAFAVTNYDFDGGLILSASHNPIGYGGMKMIKTGAVTIPGDDPELIKFVGDIAYEKTDIVHDLPVKSIYDDYINFVFSFVNDGNLKRKKILFDPLFGSVNLILKKAISNLSVKPIFIHDYPDVKFGGLSEPNPLNPEINKFAVEAAKKSQIDFGVIWDGDGDRAFFLDENGDFISAPYITAIIIESILKKNPGATIVSDPRIFWPIKTAVEKNGGKLVQSKSGYRFIKEKMAEENAIFGAEMTAHYFFKGNHNSDNGFIPFLMVWEILSESDKKLSQLVAPYKKDHYLIEEVKLSTDNLPAILEKIKKDYQSFKQDEIDGLSIESKDFRLNLRGSNTEPVVKFNMEAKSKEVLEREKNKILAYFN